MTDRVAPGAQGSTVRNIEFGQMGGVPAPFIVPEDASPTRSAERWSDLDTSELKGFMHQYSGGGDRVRVAGGEGYVDGWFARDGEYTDITDLPANETVTVVVGWDPDAVYSDDIHDSREDADRVIIDLERNVDETKPHMPIGRYETDSDGRLIGESRVDLRPLRRPIEYDGYSEDEAYSFPTSSPETILSFPAAVTALGGALAAGPIEATPDEESVVVVDLPVTQELDAGDPVSYRFMIGTQGAIDIEAEADGDGGVQNVSIAFNGTLLRDPSGGETPTDADPTAEAPDAHIEVEIGGTTYQIPAYAESE